LGSSAAVVSAEEKNASARSVLLLAPLAEGWRLLAAAFLSRSQTKNVSARSFVQDSGAPAWLRAAPRDFRVQFASLRSARIAL
jgi:hypothetical protein